MPGVPDIAASGVIEARARIAGGEVKARDAVSAGLARIEQREPELQAWAHLDPELALRRAETQDQHLARGLPLGVQLVGEPGDDANCCARRAG